AGVATRRSDHLYLTAITETMHGRLRFTVEMFNRLVILGAASCMIWFGAINFLQGFGSFRMPSMTPISSLYAAIPISGLLVTMFTQVSLPSIIGQLFNGVDSEALMAVPFFLLVGELMTSANVVIRIANLSQALVGHIRGGLAQVVTVFSMFFADMSGSTSADVAVLSRTMAQPMAQEGYDAAFVAAL